MAQADGATTDPDDQIQSDGPTDLVLEAGR